MTRKDILKRLDQRAKRLNQLLYDAQETGKELQIVIEAEMEKIRMLIDDLFVDEE